jgi:siroheme decarboxylase
MKKQYRMDKTMEKLLQGLQEGLPLNPQPFAGLASDLSLTQAEVINRLIWLREKGILRRIGFSFNNRKLGLTSTLVGLNVPESGINHASKVINKCANISHNYLRRHRLNMWFTLTAASDKQLSATLNSLQKRLKVDELINLPTAKTHKLRFQLHAA